MRSPVRAFIPVGLVAAAIVAAACTPPPSKPPINPGSSTTAPTGPTTSATTTTVVTGPPHLYSPTPIDSWGQDGIAYSVDLQGNAVYVGGDFSNAVKGKQSVARANVMAVQRDTGELLPGFVANTNGIVHVVLSDGISVYVGGEFTTVNGVPANHIAKLDAATGAVDPGFHASTTNFVADLVLVGSKLYAVGEFGQMNGVTRQGAALLDKTTGALDPTFDPNTDGRVNTVAINPAGTKLYLAGVFQSVGGSVASVAHRGRPDDRQGAGTRLHYGPGLRARRDRRTGRDGVRRRRREAEQRLRLRPDHGEAEVAGARQR